MQEQLPSAPSCHASHRGRGRPQQPPTLALTHRPDPLSKNRCRRCCFAGGISRQPQQTSATEGHQSGLLPKSYFLSKERLITSIHQVLNHRMLRGVRLDKHLSRSLAPASSARQLQQQLQCLLTCAEVGAMQKPIRCEHRRQGDPRQIHTLGQHLRANQDIRLPGGKAI